MCETGKNGYKEQYRQCAYEYHEILLCIWLKSFEHLYVILPSPCIVASQSTI